MRDLLLVLVIHMVHQSRKREKDYDVFAEREREINPCEKFRDPAGIRTQDLLNTSQTLLPLSHLDPWEKSGRQAT